MSDEAIAMRKNLTDAEKGKTVIRPPRIPDSAPVILEEASGGPIRQSGLHHLQGQGQGHTPDRGHTSSQRPYSYHTAQPYESQDFYNTDNSVHNAAGGGGGGHDVLVQKQGQGLARGQGQGQGQASSVYLPYGGGTSSTYPPPQHGKMPYSQKVDSAQKVYEPRATQSAAAGSSQTNIMSAPYSNYKTNGRQNTQNNTPAQNEDDGSSSDPLQYMS